MGFLQRGFAYGNRRGFAVRIAGGEEEQTEYNTGQFLYAGQFIQAGQRLGIPNRKVTKVAFVLQRINAAVGDVFFVINNPFNNAEIYRQLLCDASALADVPSWYELALLVPPTINQEVFMGVEYNAGEATNHIDLHYQNTDVKAEESFRFRLVCWREEMTCDCAYKYEYLTMGAPAAVYSIEQLCHNTGMFFGDATTSRMGQKLTIPNRKITHLAFRIGKLNNPTGDITFGIRRVSDDGLICSKVWGDASALPVYAADVGFTEVEFDTPPTINEEVKVYAEFLEGNGTDRTVMRAQSANVKANEGLTYYYTGVWNDFYLSTRDCTYRMKNVLA